MQSFVPMPCWMSSMKGVERLSDRHLLALFRVAKTRARAFFGHPRGMIALREELERRKLKI